MYVDIVVYWWILGMFHKSNSYLWEPHQERLLNGELVLNVLLSQGNPFWLIVVWLLIFRVFGVQWVLPKKVLDFLCGWRSRGPNLDFWNLNPWCLMRTLQRERNQCTFEDEYYMSAKLQASFISSLYEWPFVLGLIVSNLVQSFIESIHMWIFCNCNSLDYFVPIFMK